MSESIPTQPIPHSRLYTFTDAKREFALYFLEGQRLIHDLALIHPVRGGGFAYFRDAVLSMQPMIALIKYGMQLGFYIDSDDPMFRLKIETGHHGEMRCMILPDEFHEFPSHVTGIARVQKLYPGNQPPYQSVLKLNNLPLRETVNLILRDSYQVNAAMLVSDQSDQSVMLHQLPPVKEDAYDYSIEATRTRRDQIQGQLESLLAKAHNDADAINADFAEIGFEYLSSREVRFHCSCSRERVIQSLRAIYLESAEALFDPDREDIGVNCEYCKKAYVVTRTDMEQAVSHLN